MPASFLEIIELENGEIVLKRADSEDEPLLSIRFSDESKEYLPEARLEVARAMIQAGIEAASQLNADAMDEELEAEEALQLMHADDEDESEVRVLH